MNNPAAMKNFFDKIDSGDLTGLSPAGTCPHWDNPEYIDLLNRTMDVVEGRDFKSGRTLSQGARLHRLELAVQHSAPFYARHAMTSGDFPQLIADSIQRVLLTMFRMPTDPGMELVLRSQPLPDYRPAKRFRAQNGSSPLTEVPEGGAYPMDEISNVQFLISAVKFGRVFGWSWEQMVNDDLGLFNALPQQLARAAVHTRRRAATQLFATTTGWVTGFTPQTAVSALPLITDNLQAALAEFSNYSDPDGSPFLSRARYLVVCPAREWTAKEILFSDEIRFRADAAAISRGTANVVREAGLTLIIDPWIPRITTTGGPTGPGSTMWALFSDPMDVPAGELSPVRGEEDPQLYYRMNSAVGVGGGATLRGFEDDMMKMAIKMSFGSTRLEGRGAWFSNGQ